MFTRAIVRPPGLNFTEALTTVKLGAPNYPRALEQHAAYCKALEHCGLTLTLLEADERYSDSTFVEDTAVLTKQGAMLTRPGAASRIGEVESTAEALSQFYSKLNSIHEPGTLDGGDVCEAEIEGRNHFFIGVSERTNEDGADRLSEWLTSSGCTATVVDLR